MTTPISQGAAAPSQAAMPVVFQFHSTEVRTLDRDGQVWFVAGDVAQVAQALGYADATHLTRWLDEDEAALHNVEVRSENGTIQTREVTILSESGLYHALLKSRRPEAKPFRRWVTGEVLPAIRSQGRYGGPQQAVSGPWRQTRFLLSFDSENRPQTRPLPGNVSIVDATDQDSMATLMRDYIPVEMLPEILRIGLDRLARMAGSKKGATG